MVKHKPGFRVVSSESISIKRQKDLSFISLSFKFVKTLN